MLSAHPSVLRWALVPVALAVSLLLVLALAMATAQAQEPGDDGPQVPTNDIIPEPNRGRAPTDPGDRGGSLQLLVLGLVVLVPAGVALHLVRQSRRAGPPGST